MGAGHEVLYIYIFFSCKLKKFSSVKYSLVAKRHVGLLTAGRD